MTHQEEQELKQHVEALDRRLENARDDIGEISEIVDDLEHRNTSSELEGLRSEIESTDDDVDDIRNDLSDLTSKVNDIEGQVEYIMDLLSPLIAVNRMYHRIRMLFQYVGMRSRELTKKLAHERKEG